MPGRVHHPDERQAHPAQRGPLPFAETPADSSPFAAAFDKFGIPFSEQLIDFVLLIAVLYIVNSSIYACSQTLFRLAASGSAPTLLTHRRGVPWRPVLLSGFGGILGTAINWFAPEEAFVFILNSAGALAWVIYIFVCGSQVGLRMQLPGEVAAELPVRMWGHPWLSIGCAVALATTEVGMLLDPGTRLQAQLSLLALAVVLTLYGLLKLVRRRAGSA